jgi:uncharacterized protein (TIGR01244 family)
MRTATWGAALGLLAMLVGCHAGGDRKMPLPVPEEEIAADDARNLTSDGHFFMAGALTPGGLSALRTRGVETVIDLRLPSQVPKGYEQTVHQLGMNYVARPMHSNRMSAEDAGRVLESVRRYADWPMLIQCASSNRSGAIYGLYRAEADGLEVDEAIELAEEAGMRNDDLANDVRKYLETADGKSSERF